MIELHISFLFAKKSLVLKIGQYNKIGIVLFASTTSYVPSENMMINYIICISASVDG